MENTVIIKTNSGATTLTPDDITKLNESEQFGITFSSVEVKNFFSCETETVTILIGLAGGLATSAIYDTLKHIIAKTIEAFKNKNSQEEIEKEQDFEFVYKGKKTIISTKFLLTQEQKDRLFDVAIKELES